MFTQVYEQNVLSAASTCLSIQHIRFDNCRHVRQERSYAEVADPRTAAVGLIVACNLVRCTSLSHDVSMSCCLTFKIP